MFVPLLPRHPVVIAILHNVSWDSTAEEYRGFPTRRVFDPDFGFLVHVEQSVRDGEKGRTFNREGLPRRTFVR